MKSIEVFNPAPGGRSHCTPKKAAEFIRKGAAFMRPDGKIQFQAVAADSCRRRAEQVILNREARLHRRLDKKGNPMFFWNGKYPDGIFPPGSNVQFRRLWNRRQRPLR